MAFLVVAGIELDVVYESVVEHARIHAGTRVRMRALNAISTESTEGIRSIDCKIDFLSPTAEDELRTACPRGASVYVDGEMTYGGGGPFYAYVDIGDASAWMIINEPSEQIYKTVDLHIEEVQLP